MKVSAELEYKKDAPKSHSFGTRTKDGILIMVWVPKALSKKRPADLFATVSFDLAGKKGKARDEEDAEESDEEEDDDEELEQDEVEDEDEDEDEDEEEDTPPPRKKAKKAKRGKR